MKYIKKLPKLLLCTLLLAASVPLYSLAANEVNITAKLWPKSGMSLNFNEVNFEGFIGASNNAATFSLNDQIVTEPSLSVRYHTNYTAYITGTNFSDSTGNILDIERLGLSVDEGAFAPITTDSEEFTSDSGNGASNDVVNLNFNLDLSSQDNSFSDNEVLSSISDETNFVTTVTISIPGF